MSRRLLDERDFLVRSLADADAEHEAGDLSDEDYRLLRGRDQQRLDEVERRLSEPEPEPEPAPAPGAATRADADDTPTTSKRADRTRRRRSATLGLAGALLLIVGGVVLVVHLTTQRLPGQTVTGNVQLSQAQHITQELSQAGDLLNAGDVKDATTVYTSILDQDPNEPQALAQLGWLAYEQGTEAHNDRAVAAGEALESKAITVAPDFGAAHLYDGVMLLQVNNDASGAVRQFDLFLGEHPTAQNLRNGAPFIRQAFTQAHLPVPSQVPAASSSSTTAPG